MPEGGRPLLGRWNLLEGDALLKQGRPFRAMGLQLVMSGHHCNVVEVGSLERGSKSESPSKSKILSQNEFQEQAWKFCPPVCMCLEGNCVARGLLYSPALALLHLE